jgi:hypothetical protein
MSISTDLSKTIAHSFANFENSLTKEFMSLKTTLLATKQTLAAQATVIENLRSQIAGLKNANQRMRKEVEALHFRAEQKKSEPDFTAMIDKRFAQLRNNLGCLLLGNLGEAQAKPLEFNPEDNIDELNIDSNLFDDIPRVRTSATQPQAPKKQTEPRPRSPSKAPVFFQRKKQRVAGEEDEYTDDDLSCLEDIDDKDDAVDSDTGSFLLQPYGDSCPDNNSYGEYEHEYTKTRGRVPKCKACGQDSTFIATKLKKGFFYCVPCKMRYHKFHRRDNLRSYDTQLWFQTH